MRLADFICDHLEAIVDEWERYARQIPAARGMDREALRDHARQILETIAQDLRTPQSAAEQKTKSEGKGPSLAGASGATEHAAARTRAGFGIEDLLAEYRALRASVLRLWGEASGSARKTDLEDMTRFNEAIDQAVAESVAKHAAMVRQAQDLFLGILGHDLRDPLGAIAMSAQYLVHSGGLDARGAKTAAMIHHSSRQMERLIRDLLDFIRTRLGQGMPVAREEADLGELAEQAVAQASAFHPERRIALEAGGDLRGQWDPVRIGQVFSNLLGNAIKHGSADTPVQLALSGAADQVVASVHNQGPAIPRDVLDRIFEPLARGPCTGRRSGADAGLGLGLYIAREIAQAHGSAIEVASSAEAGRRFTVKLPRRAGAP